MGGHGISTRTQLAISIAGVPIGGVFSYFLTKVLDRAGLLDSWANSLGDYLKATVSPDSFALGFGLVVFAALYLLLIVFVWQARKPVRIYDTERTERLELGDKIDAEVVPASAPSGFSTVRPSSSFGGIQMPQQSSPAEMMQAIDAYLKEQEANAKLKLSAVLPAAAQPKSDDFGYSYRKAVLQAAIDRENGTLEAIDNQPARLTIVLRVENKHTAVMTDCSVIVTAISGPDGKVTPIGKPLLRGHNFAIAPKQPKRMALLVRDISDKITPEPFLLRAEGPGIPLKDNSRYLVALELRSRYLYPTHVIVEIETQTGLHAKCTISHQVIDRDGEE